MATPIQHKTILELSNPQIDINLAKVLKSMNSWVKPSTCLRLLLPYREYPAVAIAAELDAPKTDLPSGQSQTFANKTGAVIETVANNLNHD